MTTLPTNLRNDLSRVVVQARELAEAGARVALEALAVHHHEPYAHMDMEARKLRNRLRAHGRQLGDQRDHQSSTQAIKHLVEEFAYEHWHRMLFARFLAENNLLIDSELEVAITLDECRQLAQEEGSDQWALAGKYAQRMLPQIFRTDHPVFQVDLARNDRIKMEQLLESLPGEVFQASDSLGWVYQFWQAKKKTEVNASEVKIGADELPAVTQLFTEPYMVHFLLDNSLGAWWAARKLSEADWKNAISEQELRDKAAIPGVSLEFLRFVQQGDGAWRPAAGTFYTWPCNLCDLKILDPCCGSGHFLVAAFLMLVPMRIEQEGLTARDAVDAVLHENIYGLELDKRCVELAAFALALTSWKYPSSGGYRTLPELNVACSGLAISAKKEKWLALAEDNTNLRLALEELYEQFKDAPVLGSLINPQTSLGQGSLFELQLEDIGPMLAMALEKEHDDEKAEMGVVAKGVVNAASILVGAYDLVITNVPYLGRGGQSETLINFADKYYSEGSSDLATTFLMRCLDFCNSSGTTSLVCSQYWLFLKSYAGLRKKLLSTSTFECIARLGPRAFETISGEVVNVALVTLSNEEPTTQECPPTFYSVDVSSRKTPSEKAAFLLTDKLISTRQKDQLKNPDCRVILGEFDYNATTFGNYVQVLQGSSTGDDPKFVRNFWEFDQNLRWKYFQTAPDQGLFSGRNCVWDWPDDECELAKFSGARVQGLDAMGKAGFIISGSQRITHSIYDGLFYSKVLASCRPLKQEHFPAIFAFFESGEFEKQVRLIDQKNLVTPGNFLKVPFEIDHWSKVADEACPEGLPGHYSYDPTQWIFHGHPSHTKESLQVAVTRLLQYSWPAERDTKMELAHEQRELVRCCKSLISHADDDGIVCLPANNRELPAHERLLSLLQAAWGDDWHPGVLSQLLETADCKGKSLEVWLQDKFFEQHCKLFNHRPFIWHIWDGLRDGFSALINYHKLDKVNLDRLIYSYLGDWIRRQEAAAKSGENGAGERLAAARGLKKRLEAIKRGEAPLDIFVRWKSIEEQSIGWDPDLNDGVRLNIRPFMAVDDVGRSGAGILRWKPNIHWKKDRGKDVESAPWYPVFKGARINDHHLSLEEKKAARAAKESAE